MWSGVTYCNFCLSRSLDFFLHAHIPLFLPMCCAGRITLHSSAAGTCWRFAFLRFSPSYPATRAAKKSCRSRTVESICGGGGIVVCALWRPGCSNCSALCPSQWCYWHLWIYPWEYGDVAGGKWDAVSKLIIESNKSLKQMHRTLPNHGIYGPKVLERYL